MNTGVEGLRKRPVDPASTNLDAGQTAGGRRDQTSYLERETGLEPATLALARRCSTTELLPLNYSVSIAARRPGGQSMPPSPKSHGRAGSRRKRLRLADAKLLLQPLPRHAFLFQRSILLVQDSQRGIFSRESLPSRSRRRLSAGAARLAQSSGPHIRTGSRWITASSSRPSRICSTRSPMAAASGL
jgi:hypothetical protein